MNYPNQPIRPNECMNGQQQVEQPARGTAPVRKNTSTKIAALLGIGTVAGASFLSGVGVSSYPQLQAYAAEQKQRLFNQTESDKKESADIPQSPSNTMPAPEKQYKNDEKCALEHNLYENEQLVPFFKCVGDFPETKDFQTDLEAGKDCTDPEKCIVTNDFGFNKYFRAVHMLDQSDDKIHDADDWIWLPLRSNSRSPIKINERFNFISVKVQENAPDNAMENILIDGYYSPISVGTDEETQTRIYYLDACTVDLSGKYKDRVEYNHITSELKNKGGEAAIFYFNTFTGKPSAVVSMQMPPCKDELHDVSISDDY
ncbi:hypothetical protein GF340_02170 [Candidatus Peregrinibacteria bacterium]|nr:hypothetical protein [Candidatus Peregrinibacteria bacterium]